MKNPEKQKVILEKEERPEYYHGEPTGHTEYLARTDRRRVSHEQHVRLGSVLGRSIAGPASALADWNYRAEGDGHNVEGVYE